jgi:hypothetical protein
LTLVGGAMAAICPRWGCLKKARRVEMGGIPKKA